MTLAEYIAELERRVEWHREQDVLALKEDAISSDQRVMASMMHDAAAEALTEALALARQIEQ